MQQPQDSQGTARSATTFTGLPANHTAKQKYTGSSTAMLVTPYTCEGLRTAIFSCRVVPEMQEHCTGTYKSKHFTDSLSRSATASPGSPTSHSTSQTAFPGQQLPLQDPQQVIALHNSLSRSATASPGFPTSHGTSQQSF